MKSRLMQLLHDNRGVAKAMAPAARIVQAAGTREATVYIYDPIVSSQAEAEWWGGVAAQDLVPQLAKIEADTINLRINSPGGDVFAAQAISTALQQHPATVVAHIDGIAASAATAIACACDQVVMAEGAMYMIHNAWTIAVGDRNALMDTAALLEKIDNVLAQGYAARSGKSAADIAAMMDAQTWFTAQEAIDAGLADSMAQTKAKAQAWNLTAYAKAPPPEPPPPPATAAPQEPAPEAGFFMSETNANRLRLALLA